MAARPIGMLMKKTHRQLSWTRLPPMTGPNAAPIAPNADQVPIAAALELAGTEASSSESEAGTISPAPPAWTILAPISAAAEGAAPHSREPSVNVARPATKTRRRPTRSAHRPAGTRTAAKTIVYALSTHDSELSVVPEYSLPM